MFLSLFSLSLSNRKKKKRQGQFCGALFIDIVYTRVHMIRREYIISNTGLCVLVFMIWTFSRRNVKSGKGMTSIYFLPLCVRLLIKLMTFWRETDTRELDISINLPPPCQGRDERPKLSLYTHLICVSKHREKGPPGENFPPWYSLVAFRRRINSEKHTPIYRHRKCRKNIIHAR